MPPFMQEWWFMGLMIVLLLGLLGVFFYLRKQGSEDE
jgi:LPXTG-motif cell wall-anchored protein